MTVEEEKRYTFLSHEGRRSEKASVSVAFIFGVRMGKRKDFFDGHAHHWDNRLQYDKKLSQLSEIVGEFELKEGNRVLDVGTGTGILLPLLKKSHWIEREVNGYGLLVQDVGTSKTTKRRRNPHSRWY